jgi:hypothetical protein
VQVTYRRPTENTGWGAGEIRLAVPVKESSSYKIIYSGFLKDA